MPASLTNPTPSATTRTVPLPPPPQTAGRGWLIVRLALGVLLVVTAVLMMTGGSADALRTALPIVSPRLYASGVMAEFILGVWLLSGLAPAWSRLCGLGFFGLLAALSFQLGVTGQASCGCLGKLPVSPWWAFAVDVTAIGGLLVFRPGELMPGIRKGLPIAVGGVALAALVVGCFLGAFGSLNRLIAMTQGKSLVPTRSSFEVGEGPPGASRSIEVSVTNYSDRPVTIVGGTSDCRCMMLTQLPVAVPPYAERTVAVDFRFTGSPGRFRRSPR
jgi:hypothetical protein